MGMRYERGVCTGEVNVLGQAIKLAVSCRCLVSWEGRFPDRSTLQKVASIKIQPCRLADWVINLTFEHRPAEVLMRSFKVKEMRG